MSYDEDNVFAKILRGELPNHTVYETDKVLAFMDIMPFTNGHCVVIPKAASRNIFDARDEDLAAVISAVKLLSNAVMKAFDADGVTVRQNNEQASGQVVFHTHFHVIPRLQNAPMKKQDGTMEDQTVLAENAAKIKTALTG